MVRSISSVLAKEESENGSPIPALEEGSVYHVSLKSEGVSPFSDRIQLNYLYDGKTFSDPSNLNIHQQEACLINELLNAFMGMEGVFVHLQDMKASSEFETIIMPPSFYILPGFDLGIKDIASEMLEMGSHYLSITAFIESRSHFEYGFVNHALCAALRKFVMDYVVLIMQCENQSRIDPNFSLQTLRLYTLPTSRSLRQVYLILRDLLLSMEKNASSSDDLGLSNIDDLLEQLNEGNDISQVVNATRSKKKVCKGGQVISFLTESLTKYAGDPVARKILTYLLREASRPYTKMLNEWIHLGLVNDPYDEFMIKIHKGITSMQLDEDYTDEYWEKRYVIREDQVPPQLLDLQNKVLFAGKYLNVVLECRKGVNNLASLNAKDDTQNQLLWPSTFDADNFTLNIMNAYVYANESLLQLLQSSQSLYAHLYSLKHYFFLDQSDFFTTFLDNAQHELRKPAKYISITKLQSQLDLAFRQPGTITATDPHKEYVTVEVNQTSLIDWLMHIVSISGLEEGTSSQGNEVWNESITKQADVGNETRNFESEHNRSTQGTSKVGSDKEINGFETMQLCYKVPFPLSLILSRKAIIRYQLLFRYFLLLRHVEMQLENSWVQHSKNSAWRLNSSNAKIEQWKRNSWLLRTRMLSFVQKIIYYTTSEVIETHWGKFMGELENARTVDNLMQEHIDFLDTCLKECMLTNSRLLKVQSKLLNTCAMFASYTSTFTRSLYLLENSEESFDEGRMDKMEEILRRYEDSFSRHLKSLVNACNYFASTETAALLSLVMKLTG
ncbi:Spindle pole body component alp4 [Schizosaccharomyces pombe]